MISLYPTPDPLDLDGWRGHLDWLRSEPKEIASRENAIERAEMMIRLLENPSPAQRPTEAA